MSKQRITQLPTGLRGAGRWWPGLLLGLLAPGPAGAAPGGGVVHADLRPHFTRWEMPPRAQGGRGTCSVFTVTGGLEYALACRRGRGVPLSAEYLNWAADEAQGERGDGSFFHQATAGYERFGICQDRLMPYQAEWDANRRPPDEAAADGPRQLEPRLAFHWIKKNGTPQGLTDDEFAAIKRTILSGWPVCAGSGHSVLYVGYHEDPQFPGWSYFITRDSGRGGYGAIPCIEAKRILCDALWVEAPGVTPPAPATKDPDLADPASGAPAVRGRGLHFAWAVRPANPSLHALAFSPDGRMLAAAWRHPAETRLYNAGTGGQVGFLGNGDMSAAFSPDGATLATGAHREIRCQEASTGRLVRTLAGHTDWVEAVAYSRDGKWMASGSGDRSVRLWSLPDGTCRQTLAGPTGPVSQVWISPDGGRVCASSWDHTLRVWDAGTGVELASVPGCDAACFGSDGKSLAVGRDGRVDFLLLADGERKPPLACEGRVTAVAYSRDGRLLAAANDRGVLRLWRVRGSKLLGEAEIGAAVGQLEFGLDGRRLAAGTTAGGVSVFTVR